MSFESEIKEILLYLIKDQAIERFAICTVKDVDKSAGTITASPVNGDADFLKVLLKADRTGGILLLPAVGSVVVVALIDDHNGFVSMFSEVDKVNLQATTGFKINTPDEDLKTWLKDFVKEVYSIKVTTPNGPSGEVITKPNLQQLETRLDKLFAD